MKKLLLLLSFLGFCLASSAQAAKFDANYNFKILNNNPLAELNERVFCLR